jgi:hypothetical protein
VASGAKKRGGRRKRKTRAAAEPSGTKSSEGTLERAYARSRERDREARENLEPIREGERPRVVTLGAIFSALIALVFWISAGIALFSNAKVNGSRPNPLQLAAIALLMSAMSYGMWGARYWAVLGFQMLLVLLLLAASAGLVTATTVLQLIGTSLLIALSATFFYFMIRAMARIQMPQRLPRK